MLQEIYVVSVLDRFNPDVEVELAAFTEEEDAGAFEDKVYDLLRPVGLQDVIEVRIDTVTLNPTEGAIIDYLEILKDRYDIEEMAHHAIFG